MDGRVFRRNRHLHAALGHHAVGIAEAELRGQDDFGALAVRVQRSRAPGPASADDEHIRHVGGSQVEVVRNGAIAFEQSGQFHDRLLAGVGTESDRSVCALAVIGMIFFYQRVTFGWRILGQRLGAPKIAGLVHDLLENVNVHDQLEAIGDA